MSDFIDQHNDIIAHHASVRDAGLSDARVIAEKLGHRPSPFRFVTNDLGYDRIGAVCQDCDATFSTTIEGRQPEGSGVHYRCLNPQTPFVQLPRA